MRMAYTTNEKLPKLRAEAVLMVRKGKSTREVARYFGYAQSTIVKWRKRASKNHLRSIPTRNSRPHNSPKSLPRETVAKIIYMRKQTKRCAEVVHRYLAKDGIIVSLSSVKRTLARFCLSKARSPWKRRRVYPPKPEAKAPGMLVEMDTIHFMLKNNQRVYVYTAIDVCSRYSHAMISKRANTHASIKFLKETKACFPFTITTIQTDNGSEFGKFFTDTIVRLRVFHRHIHPRSPNENGHIERFNRTIQEEIPKHRLCIFMKDDVSTFLDYYNNERIHMAIDYKTPKEMLAN